MSAGVRVGCVVLLVLRLATAGLFMWAALLKLADVQEFRQAIRGFYVVPDHITDPLAFLVPWTELVCAAALAAGFWGRSAALVVGALLLAFIGAILSVIARPEIHTSCGCFGDLTLMCPPGEVGWCNVGQNLILLAIAAPVMIWGPGALSWDSRAARRCGGGCGSGACCRSREADAPPVDTRQGAS